jgi:hypothetical protein
MAVLIGGSTEAVLIRGTCESTLATTSLLFNAAFLLRFRYAINTVHYLTLKRFGRAVCYASHTL